MPRQQATWIDRIFNSTIALPQQLIWRVIRAMKEDDVDLWSEKGLFDFANVPLLGMWDDHKEDVMPDYMAETMFGIEEGETTWKSELGAAVLSDPLFYLTGTLSALGKAAKGAQIGARGAEVTRQLGVVARATRGSKMAGRGHTGQGIAGKKEVFGSLSGREYLAVLDRAEEALLRNPSRYAKPGVPNAQAQLRGIVKARKLMRGLDKDQLDMPIRELMEKEGHRKLAYGIPGLAKLGARIPIPGDQQSWWQVYKQGQQLGGVPAAMSWMTRKLTAIPVIGTALKESASWMTAPTRQLAGGWKVGAESRSAIVHAKEAFDDTKFDAAKHWLNSATGGSEVAVRIQEKGIGNILKRFDDAVEGGKSVEEAFTYAMARIRRKGDTNQELWARMNGVDTAHASSLPFPKTIQELRGLLEDGLNKAVTQGELARSMALSGRYDATLAWRDIDKKASALLEERDKFGKVKVGGPLGGAVEALGGTVELLLETVYNTGVGARKLTNNIFKTGTPTQHAQEAMQRLVSTAAAGHDQVSGLSKILYAGMKKLADHKDLKGWGDNQGERLRTIEGIMGGLMESSALEVEMIESLRLSRVNPTNLEEVAKGWESFMERHFQIMKTMETVLTSRGVTGDIRDTMVNMLSENVWRYLPKLGKNRMQAILTKELKSGTLTREVLTTAQKARMGRRENAYVFEAAKEGGKHDGVALGKLTDEELGEALEGIQKRGSRQVTDAEVFQHIEGSAVIKQFRDSHGLTNEELITVFRRHGKGKNRRIWQKPTEYPLWKERKEWDLDAAQGHLDRFGLSLTRGEDGSVTLGLDIAGFGKGVEGFADIRYSTIDDAMVDARKWLGTDKGKQWRRVNGPDIATLDDAALRKLSKKIDIPADTVDKFKLQLKINAASDQDFKMLMGKAKRFDEHDLRYLSTADYANFPFIQKVLNNRIISRKAGYIDGRDELFEGVVVPTIEKLKTLGPPRKILPKDVHKKGFEWGTTPTGAPKKEADVIIDGTDGVDDLSTWASTYAVNRAQLAEIINWMKKYKKADISADVPYEMLSDIGEGLALMGKEIESMTLRHMPKEARNLFLSVKHISRSVFNAAQESGLYMPGSPVGYIGRFFNRNAAARVQRVIGEMALDTAGLQVLKRISNKSPSHFHRNFDAMTIPQLNDVHERLRTLAAASYSRGPKKGTPVSNSARRWHEELEQIMKEEGGTRRKGSRERLAWDGKRLEDDPILNTLARLSNANQEGSIEKYFDSFLKAGIVEDGKILAMGGKVIAILDDSLNPIEVGIKALRVVERKAPKGKPVKLRNKEGTYKKGVAYGELSIEEQQKMIKAGKPSWVVIETSDGRKVSIPAHMDLENGYGLLRLGKPLPEGVDLGVDAAGKAIEPTVAQSYVHASSRGNLDNSYVMPSEMAAKPLGTEGNIYDLIGEHVVYGAKNIVMGGVKTASQVLKVTAPAWRAVDSINYMIKSFQTVFRLPFHLANLASGVFQAHMAGVSTKSLIGGYVDAIQMLYRNTEFIKSSDTILALSGVEGFTSRGFHLLPRNDVMNATRRAGGRVSLRGDDKLWAEMQELGLDRVDDLVLNLGSGQQLAMSDFIQVAGDMQLYGTYAASITRGSRTIADSLVQAKLGALDPTKAHNMGWRALGKVIKSMGGRPGELREVSENINRTATAMGLIRDGHTLERAIEITKNAHVPYERLTTIERSVLKRAFLYYSFPRHYIPWAGSKFLEDPTKLAALTNLVKQKKLITTDEGRAHLKLGDYRLDVGRLNANLEASMMVGAFADMFAHPIGHKFLGMGDAKMHPYDPNVLTNQITDSGMLSFGGLIGWTIGGRKLFPQGVRAGQSPPDTWDDARTAIWPIKLGLMAARHAGMDIGTPSKEEQSPYVDYTPMESLIYNSDWGLGVRKVRHNAEAIHAYYRYRQLVRKLQLKASATKDPAMQRKYQDNAKQLTDTLQGMFNNHMNPAFK